MRGLWEEDWEEVGKEGVVMERDAISGLLAEKAVLVHVSGDAVVVLSKQFYMNCVCSRVESMAYRVWRSIEWGISLLVILECTMS